MRGEEEAEFTSRILASLCFFAPLREIKGRQVNKFKTNSLIAMQQKHHL
jgi:hypothetical protein